ncbi:hypothetical protein AMTR_s00070p00083830 [Amborella trichopoda]|uniref:Uncharacterized protein n=1 Tax=Amborella trichopoda TaxID=13333 RepID=U5DJ28_AMBTC|nr:hypothetical protein AMTR_s00070p00083830 [Amborella trichopoda]
MTEWEVAVRRSWRNGEVNGRGKRERQGEVGDRGENRWDERGTGRMQGGRNKCLRGGGDDAREVKARKEESEVGEEKDKGGRVAGGRGGELTECKDAGERGRQVAGGGKLETRKSGRRQ